MTYILSLAAIGFGAALNYGVGIPLFRLWLGFHPICGL